MGPVCPVYVQVTLLHVEGHVDSDCSHHFQVDRSMNNVTLHLAGVLTDCTLHSPNGDRPPTHTHATQIHSHILHLYSKKILHPFPADPVCHKVINIT